MRFSYFIGDRIFLYDSDRMEWEGLRRYLLTFEMTTMLRSRALRGFNHNNTRLLLAYDSGVHVSFITALKINTRR